MKERSVWVVVVLAVLLVGALIYIGVDKYFDWKVNKDNTIYQQGIEFGYQQTVIQLAKSAATCQQVPLVVGNQTINIIAVDCLQQQPQ